MADIDLEALARGYEHRPSSNASFRRAESALEGLPSGGRVLDVGGGRGDHAALWAAAGFQAVVLDPSERMAVAAKRHRGVSVARGRGEAMPFADASFALVYFHLSLHYGDWRSALRETQRVLLPRGRCVIWTLGPRHHRASMLAQWFPSIAEIDEARFPDPEEVCRYLVSIGSDVMSGESNEVVKNTASRWRMAVEAGFISTLQLIDGAELRAGLTEFDNSYPDPGEELTYEMHWDWIVSIR